MQADAAARGERPQPAGEEAVEEGPEAQSAGFRHNPAAAPQAGTAAERAADVLGARAGEAAGGCGASGRLSLIHISQGIVR